MVWSVEKKKGVCAELNDSIDALAMNRERTHVAAAGRTGLKIFSVDGNKFELKSDLRKTRKTSMHFYLSLAWSPLKDNLIASSLLNGCVLLWDLGNYQASYPEQQYKAHKQAATKVAFSEFNENLLISGSKEGTVLLYDIRQPEPSLSFSNKDTIRDLHFCMESKLQDVFVTADDSGSVRFWDLKRPDRVFKEFIAHTGHVSSIALNPQLSSKNLIATAGRDKFIRVWDWSKQNPERLYTVETMAPLTRVSWCPDNAWHLASCSTANDNCIHVWDIRRPFLPYASFSPHLDTVTDMCWPRYGTGDRFISSGKDGRLVLNFMEHAARPLSYANTVAISCASPYDGVIVALPERKRSSSCVSATDALDPFRRNAPSALVCVTPLDADATISRSKTISYLAKHYKLFGGSVERLCGLNADVAERAATFNLVGTSNTYMIANGIASKSDDGFGSGGDDGSCCQLAYSWRTVALLCAGTELLSGGGRSSATQQLLTRRELYRCTLFRRDGSFDGVTRNGPDLELYATTTNGNERLSTGESEKFLKKNGNNVNAHESADSGSESDESSSMTTISSSASENGAAQNKKSIATAELLVARRARYSGNGRRRRRRAFAAATTLISGSLSQITQNSLNADFFFGVNELNLYGMSGSAASAGYGGKANPDVNNNDNIGATNSRRAAARHQKQRTLEADDKQSLLNCSSDLSKVKDEAFDFRAYRRHGESDDFGGDFAPHHRCGARAEGFSAQRQRSAHHQHQLDAEMASTSGENAQHHQQLLAADGRGDEEGDRSPGIYSVLPPVDDYSNAREANADAEARNAVDAEEANALAALSDEIIEEVVDLIDDVCIEDALVDAQMSASYPTSAANSISGDDPELEATVYSSENGCRFGVTLWDPLPKIKSILDYYSEIGDVQTCAAICLVLGEKLAELKLVKIAQIDLWLFAYLELLERLEMWNAVAALVKMCYRSKMNQLSNESTFVKSICTNCNTVSLKSSSRCRECTKSLYARCCTCEQLVRGIWSACAECGHGGHVAHMSAWFAQFSFCPFLGCGHLCAPSNGAIAPAETSSSIASYARVNATRGTATSRSMPHSYCSQQQQLHQRSPYSLTPPLQFQQQQSPATVTTYFTKIKR